METDPRPERCAPGIPHLGPALCALLAISALLTGVRAYISRRLPGDLPSYAAHASSFKVNGNALQTAAFRAPGELPIYGSSELDRWVDNRADAFFARRPSGFAVFPIGRGGTTSLMIAQKLAAVGSASSRKKAVVFLSSSWFLVPSVGADAVAANLGASQLSAWVFSDDLSPALKSALAQRLLDFPAALKGQVLLSAALRCLSEATRSNRWCLALLSPLGKLQNTLFKRLDDGVLLWEIVFPQNRWRQEYPHEPSAPPLVGGRIAWSRLLTQAGEGPHPPVIPAATVGEPEEDRTGAGKGNQGSAAGGGSSREFADLGLLIRVLQERKMQALFISQPLNQADAAMNGHSEQDRQAYYDRLRALLGNTRFPLRDFSDHEGNPSFFSDVIHPSARAWLFYDREIDRFYSGATD